VSASDAAARVPPGQHLTKGWPILHASPIPTFNEETWRFRCFGSVDEEVEWTWEQFRALPSAKLVADMHCVTGWTKLDNEWEGAFFREVAARARPKAETMHALIHAPYGYTANLPLQTLLDDGLFAWAHDGEPLPPEHGGPLRLVVPTLYAWKSVKWANGVQFLERDIRGYWEERGYHNRADPWREERYSWQESG
jgi:DMSO/TMAO reductase YedYZ molybdopterin-dependent catalytic subunit